MAVLDDKLTEIFLKQKTGNLSVTGCTNGKWDNFGVLPHVFPGFALACRVGFNPANSGSLPSFRITRIVIF
jgi:hypothetical protein